MPTVADKANDYRLPGAGTRRSSRIGRRPSKLSTGKNTAVADKGSKKQMQTKGSANANAEPEAKKTNVNAEPKVEDSTQQKDSRG